MPGRARRQQRPHHREVSEVLCAEVGLKNSVQRVRKAFAEQDGELVDRLHPGNGRHLPIFLDICVFERLTVRYGGWMLSTVIKR